MPPPPAIPRTHSVTVDLVKIFHNIQQAITSVYGENGTPLRQPEFPAAQDEYSCHIETMDALKNVLQPALTAGPSQYVKKWFNGNWVHLLAYSDEQKEQQHIIVTPFEIFSTKTGQQCSLNQGLAHYFGVALDVTPPASAQDERDAAMVGYIRCLGTGKQDCLQYKDYAPLISSHSTPTNANLDSLLNVAKMLKLQALASAASSAKLKHLYINKSTQYAMNLAMDVQKNAQAQKQHIERLITYFVPRLKTDDNKPLDDETKRLAKDLNCFLRVLFSTTDWQLQYNRFRNDFLNAGCTEYIDDPTGTRYVDCPQLGYQFSAKANTTVARQ